MDELLTTDTPAKLIVIPEDKWGLFSAIHNYPICIIRGHDWMHFLARRVDGRVDIFWFCRRCGLERNATGKWDAAYRENDYLESPIKGGE